MIARTLSLPNPNLFHKILSATPQFSFLDTFFLWRLLSRSNIYLFVYHSGCLRCKWVWVLPHWGVFHCSWTFRQIDVIFWPYGTSENVSKLPIIVQLGELLSTSRGPMSLVLNLEFFLHLLRRFPSWFQYNLSNISHKSYKYNLTESIDKH